MPKTFKVVNDEEGKKLIESGKYVVLFIPIEDVEDDVEE